MAQAIERFVPDGATIAMGVALEAVIPFAAGHEMIRQRRRNLELVGPISDALFDQLIGAGCVRRVTAAWIGNVSEGLAHCYRRACEHRVPGPLEVRDHSNFSISLALWAAAWNVPSLPTRTLLGSDILRTNPDLSLGAGLVHVKAVRPDVAIVHAQRADEQGRAHAWGPLGITEEAGLAAERVIVSCEELVDPSVILSDPNRILFPETRVAAVVHEPGGAHPSPVQGFFKRDHAFYREYGERSRTEEGFEPWLREWVVDVPDRAAYMRRIDAGALWATRMSNVMALMAQGHVDLGFIGGAEVDRFGNLNTSYVGEPRSPKVKLPGSGGGADIAILSRRWVTLMSHERRRLVDRVSFITSPGHGDGTPGWRKRNGLLGGGPAATITQPGGPRFPEGGGEAYLASVHPGCTVEDVRRGTGWELKVADDVSETSAPTESELAAIRRFDPDGFWTSPSARSAGASP